MATQKCEEFKEFKRIREDARYALERFGKIKPTHKEISEKLDISIPTLTIWEKKVRREGEGFDAEYYLNENIEDVFKKLISTIKEHGKPSHIESALKLWRVMIDRKQERKGEYTSTDRINIGIETRESLVEEFKRNGSCPVCGFSKALHGESCEDTEPEHDADSEVGAVGLPAGVA